eukprot:1595857-Amphidinium_carterae.2
MVESYTCRNAGERQMNRGKMRVHALWWRQHKAMYGGESTDSNAVPCVEADPRPERSSSCCIIACTTIAGRVSSIDECDES